CCRVKKQDTMRIRRFGECSLDPFYPRRPTLGQVKRRQRKVGARKAGRTRQQLLMLLNCPWISNKIERNGKVISKLCIFRLRVDRSPEKGNRRLVPAEARENTSYRIHLQRRLEPQGHGSIRPDGRLLVAP